MQTRILAFLLICSCLSTASATIEDHSFTLYLIRHAEKKQDGSRDPELTEIGIQRSEKLAVWFSKKNIKDVWSSDYKRTRDTAKPILTELNVELNLYDPGNLPLLSEKLMSRQHAAVVVGHSNTTPDLARLLCDCVIEDMDESEHSRLIVIKVNGDETQVQILRQQ